MDKLRRLFSRKNSKPPARDIVSPPSTAKRPRSHEDEPPPNWSELESRKRMRMTPDMALHDHKARPATHTSSTQGSAEKDAPKLDWKPVDTNLDTIFDGLSVSAQNPQPRPLASVANRTNAPRSKAWSMPAQAIFARGVKRYSEDKAPKDVAQEKPRESEVEDRMSLEDFLTKPLFGEKAKGAVH
ncbi:hypothetical protein NA57DRAFT_56726 [Rhizodiscina lignyota]|uniref:Uncharacterized protein n=1 Tax=Rhizodiscina lignyota TaxID=1504668 RepID=A0A9P4M5W6_9PEZI|nr:hypothetical protein NA57DRAFT_56726 [Rhizodiscina lignyota]